MDDRPSVRDSRESIDEYTGTPRWVKAFGIVAIVVVILIGLVVFTGMGGSHGPQRHAPSGAGPGHDQASMGRQLTVI